MEYSTDDIAAARSSQFATYMFSTYCLKLILFVLTQFITVWTYVHFMGGNFWAILFSSIVLLFSEGLYPSRELSIIEHVSQSRHRYASRLY
ncbi:hypothetical protein C8R48DRAFT_106453 [Suillus tomentosus]|nr:hypothetical protein C8R48DRAFT_106453 [Suillus tomentosus]